MRNLNRSKPNNSIEKKEEEKLQTLLNILNLEIANIFEITDGGYNFFPSHQPEIENEIYLNLANLKKIITKKNETNPKEIQYNYELIKSNNKNEYLKSLGENLRKIKNLIDQINFHPNITELIQECIENAIKAYKLLEFKSE